MARQHRKGSFRAGDGKNAGERTCIVHRKAKSPDEMFRFVVDPGHNRVVPDIECVLPGRGVWVTAARTDIDFAVRKGLFSRGFKTAVRADGDLGERLEAMLEKAAQQALSLTAKAGLVVTGFEKVRATLDKSQLRALIFASDGAQDGIRKMRSKAQKVQYEARSGRIAVHQSLRSEQMALALGRSHVIHAALLEGGATEMCLKAILRLEKFRSGQVATDTDETNID